MRATRRKKILKLIRLYLGFAKGYKKPIHGSVCFTRAEWEVKYDRNGASLVEAFASYDDKGIMIPTRHANALQATIHGKAVLNLWIKTSAEGECIGVLELMLEYPEYPDWVWTAIYAQGKKYWEKKYGPLPDVDPKEMTKECRELAAQERTMK